ncbi:MAG: energy-coupling factor ABC transporter permease [Verrucomicrobiae bacterium]|nr:energy-coupling factor ABC transporter permease [Verrucomicrobiae bacterium]MDW8342890.1 energy-coupling factor ABC transporter permease [Verrucomicrobiae bacterium]
MHIPDGFIDVKTAVGTAVLAATGAGLALRQAQRELPPRKVPLLGVAAAFIFAAQMLNFPVAGGTSGHLIGGVLAAVLLGPAAAVVVMTAVLVVQTFLFQDGGVSALGANVFNMAIVAPVAGYALYRLVRPAIGLVAAAAFAGWCSTVVASLSCAGQLAVSGTVAWNVVIPAMAGIHMLIGLGEGVITALVLVAIGKTRPELLDQPDAPVGTLVPVGLVVALGLALFVSPFASSWPDGLEKVAEHLGFDTKAAETPMVPAPIPDYEVPGIGSPAVATALAGGIGTVVVFGLSWLLARMLVPKKPA